jgi:general stress protein 26
MSQSPKQQMHSLLTGFNTAVLVTRDGHGFRARPMAIAHVDVNCNLWFFSNRDSGKIHEIERDTRVEVVCQDGWTNCVTISGRASLVNDREKIRELWKAPYRAWFPKGADDPDIVLIHVLGDQGEYWDNSGLKSLSYLYQSIKAVATGTTPEVREGDQHGNVRLTH